MKKFFLFAAVAMLALVGCEKQNQSSLDFEQVQQSAKISGTLVYMADKAGAATVETPVAGQRIFFQVAGGQYATGAEGSKQFEATTKEDGSFEIVVPTGAKSINGDLKTDVIVLGEGANRVFLDETSKNIDLVAGDAKVEKRIAAINNTLTACQGTATVKGTITYNAGIVEKDGAKETGFVNAPAGTKVTITVAYDDAVKALVTTTKADGTYSYEVPVPAASALPIEVAVAQFAGKYTDEFNNGLLTVDAVFDAAPVTGISATDGEVTKADITAIPSDIDMPKTKNTKVKVKGEWLVEAEVFEYGTGDEAKKIKSLDKGTKKYTPELNGGAFELILTNTNEGTAITYDLKVDENGKFETEVAIYDSWNFNDVEITTRIKKFVNSEFSHYYMKYYKSPSTSKAESEWEAVAAPGKWQDWTDKDNFTNQYGTQSCEGTYEAEEQAIPLKYDGFFAVKVDNTLKFSMSADAKAALLGVAKGDNDKMKDKDGNEHTIYGGGIDKF